MTPWQAWLSDVSRYAHSAPIPLAEHALNRAAREFMRRTRAWMLWLEPEINSTSREFFIPLPVRTDLVRIEQATIGANPVPVQSYRLERSDWTRHSGGSIAVVSGDLLSFTLTGVNANPSEPVQIQASLMPSVRSEGLPDELAARFREAIAAGAIADLLLTPNTKFFSPDLAAVFRSDFERWVNSHCVDAFRGHTNQVPRSTVKWC